MTRVTFGVSASSFAANMAVKQSAHDNIAEYPQAAETVEKSFYVDDTLTGVDTVTAAMELQNNFRNFSTEEVYFFANGMRANLLF